MIEQSDINTFSKNKLKPCKLVIDGKLLPSESEKTIDVISPIDGQLITTIPDANKSDINIAVQSARKAFNKGVWSKADPRDRKKILLRFAELIEKHSIELAVLGVRDNGTEINMALFAEPMGSASTIRYYSEAIDKIYGEIAPTSNKVLGLIHREPIGVVGAIVPWNFPLMVGTWKFAPALAAGNSVIIKPAETASLSLLRVAELALEAGIPEGVFNVVTGEGLTAGKALAKHMDVDVIAFTGSGVTGRKILEYSAQSNLKRVYLELGGKSPNIIFADIPDLDVAVASSSSGIFKNSGQVCIAGSRIIVEKSIADEFTDKMIKNADSLKVGNPLDLSTDIGAISNKNQLKKNLEYVKTAIKEGGILRAGGKQIHHNSGGYYMQPTIFSDVNNEMTIAQEEVFGPLLGILTFNTPEEAIEIANSSPYGLAAGVWTSNLSQAHSMIRKIRAGVVHVNCYGGADITVPLGGVKQSGNGHDKSLHAIDKYTDLKTAWIAL